MRLFRRRDRPMKRFRAPGGCAQTFLAGATVWVASCGCDEEQATSRNRANVIPPLMIRGELTLARPSLPAVWGTIPYEEFHVWGVVTRHGEFSCAPDQCQASVSAFTPFWGAGAALDGSVASVIVWCDGGACPDLNPSTRLLVRLVGNDGLAFSMGPMAGEEWSVSHGQVYGTAYRDALAWQPSCASEQALTNVDRLGGELPWRASDLAACTASHAPVTRMAVEVHAGGHRVFGAVVDTVGQLAGALLAAYVGEDLCSELFVADQYAAPESIESACARRWQVVAAVHPETQSCDDCTVAWVPLAHAE